MADTTIEWTATRNADGTVTKGVSWNPVRGCSRASEGCRNCYAEKQAYRITQFDRGAGKLPGEGSYDNLVSMTSQGPKWTGLIRLIPEKLSDPLGWRKPRTIFVDSMSDLFHEKVPFDYIAAVFGVMAATPQHTYIVLTKRPARMLEFLTSDDRPDSIQSACKYLDQIGYERGCGSSFDFDDMLPNVILGVSIEDQATADERVPLLLKTPAARRAISAEPLLGPVDLADAEVFWAPGLSGGGLNWVIVGGESGNDARPMHPDWARSLRDQCQAAGVAFFFKQWGEWVPVIDEDEYLEPDAGADPAVGVGNYRTLTAHGQAFAKVGKNRGGRMLDGREWSEFPEAR